MTTNDIQQIAAANSGMLFACWAILIVLAAMFFTFLRAGKTDYAVAVLPLALPPLIYIPSGLIARWLGSFLPVDSMQLMMSINLIAGLVACLMIGITSRRIQPVGSRRAFSLCCAGFIMILTVTLVLRTLPATA